MFESNLALINYAIRQMSDQSFSNIRVCNKDTIRVIMIILSLLYANEEQIWEIGNWGLDLIIIVKDKWHKT